MPRGIPKFPAMLETEKTLIGSLLRDQDLAEVVTAELTEEDFYDDTTRTAYTACRLILDSGGTLSPLAVHERSGVKLDALDGYRQDAQGVSQKQLQTLIAEVKRVSRLRKTYQICSEVSSSIVKDSKVEEVLSALEKGLFSVGGESSEDTVDDASDVFDAEVADVLDRERQGGGPLVSTGLKTLDNAIIGLRPGKLMVIAGRPSMGKTALMCSIRRAVVGQEVHPSLRDKYDRYGAIEFHLEMSKQEVAQRELAFRAGTDLRQVIAAKGFTDEQRERIRASAGAILPGQWSIADRTYTIAGIRRKARIVAGRMARQRIKVGLVTVDYLQLAGGDDEDGNRERLVASVSRGCKLLAKELGCTVIAVSQLNRGCESREDKRPLMSDLRESGAIEQDADCIAFVFREHMYDSSFPASDTELIIRKQKDGPTGTVRLKYNDKLVTFEN